jgi:hypothetical protein
MNLVPDVEPGSSIRIIRMDPLSEPRWDEFVQSIRCSIFLIRPGRVYLQDGYSPLPILMD